MDTDGLDNWRWRCPRWHTNWETRHRTDRYYCETCREYFDELHDIKERGA